MRFYIIILSDIPDQECDFKFAKKIQECKFEWWRRTALNWILATPDKVSTNEITSYVVESYGLIFSTILEVNINDVGGVYPTIKSKIEEGTPFDWFRRIKDPSFIPAWEKNTDDSPKSNETTK